MQKFLRNTLMAALLVAVMPAQAAIQNWNYGGTFDSGVYVDESFSGSFSFDDAALTNLGEEWISLSSIHLSVLGEQYGGQQLSAPAEVFFLDGALIGVGASFNAVPPQFTLVAGTFDRSESFLAYSPAAGFEGAGSISFTAAVPEPETYGMLLAGLGMIGFMARRRYMA